MNTNKRVTKKQIDKALKKAGIDGEIFRGDGYQYFIGKSFDKAYTTSVMVPRLSDLSVERWVEEAKHLIQEGI